MITSSKGVVGLRGVLYEKHHELTVFTNPVKKSSGTLNSSSGGSFTLKPSNSATTFTASVSGGGLVDLTGTITFTDSSSQTGPGTITPITDATETVHADLRGTWYCSAQNATFVFTANSVTVKLGSSTVATGKVLNCVSDTNTNGSTASTYPSGYMLTIQTTSGINFSSNTLFALNVAKTQFLENGDSNKGPYVKQ